MKSLRNRPKQNRAKSGSTRGAAAESQRGSAEGRGKSAASSGRPKRAKNVRNSKSSTKNTSKPEKAKFQQAPRRDTNERLQKVLAAAGLGSRRACEELILDGRVEVDRKVITKLGTCVDADRQKIQVDGVPLIRKRRYYFIVNKPAGVLSTGRDPWSRLRVVDLIDSTERLFTIGRLDKASTGLMVVTNDGELANLVAHPRYGVEKVYRVTVQGEVSFEVISKLRRGMHLADGNVRPTRVTLKKQIRGKTLLEIVLAEGRNREIRRMLARVGHKVINLERIALGPLRLADLPLGAHRRLTTDEVKRLKEASLGRSTGRNRRRSGKRKTERPVQQSSRGHGGQNARPRFDKSAGGFQGAVLGAGVPADGNSGNGKQRARPKKTTKVRAGSTRNKKSRRS